MRQREVLVRDVDDHRVELDRLQLQVAGSPARAASGDEAAAEADEEDVLRLRPVGEGEVEVVRVLEPWPNGSSWYIPLWKELSKRRYRVSSSSTTAIRWYSVSFE